MTLFLAAPGVAAADDGSLPLVPIDTAPAVSPTAVTETVAAVPAVETVAEVAEAAAAAAPAPVAAAAPVAEAIPAAIAPDEPAAAVAETAASTSSTAPSVPASASNTVSPEQYQPAEERYQPATAPEADEKAAPDAAPTGANPSSRSAGTASTTETPPPQFVWNWVWHCAPAIDMADVPFPQNLPDNAIINWVWDSSCSSANSSPVPDQYQETGSQYHQQNIVVSIRVNSPGDDGAVTQGNVVGSLPGPVMGIPPPAPPPLMLPSVPLPFQMAPLPLPAVPMPVRAPALPALEAFDSAVGALAETPVAVALTLAAPKPQSPQSAAASGEPPATPSVMTRRSLAAPAVWTTAPAGSTATPVMAARPARATRQRPPKATPIDRLPSGPLPLDPISTYVAGSAGGGAGGSSGLLLSALAALLAAYLLWPPLQWGGVVSVAGGPRKRVDGGRLEKPG